MEKWKELIFWISLVVAFFLASFLFVLFFYFVMKVKRHSLQIGGMRANKILVVIFFVMWALTILIIVFCTYMLINFSTKKL